MTYSVTDHCPLKGLFSDVEDTTKLSRSIIVPFFNEEGCVRRVIEEIRACQPQAEIVAVDDGSSDRTGEILADMGGVKAVLLAENRGQSAAIFAGLMHATLEVVVLLDGDGQNDPADIERLIEGLSRADLVVGYRAKRRDSWSRRAASRIANRIRRHFLDDGVRDTGCSLKAFARAHVELLVPFNGLHRYLPAVFKKAGLLLEEIPVNHRQRVEGTSKYTNWERGLRGIYDLIGVAWLLRRKINFPEIKTRG